MIQSEPIQGYVPARPKEQTPAYKLFHYYFVVEIAQMHLSDSENLRQGGNVTTGNPQLDRELANTTVHCNVTVAAMAQFHYEGVSMKLAQPEDSVKIYQLIYDHLQNWQQSTASDVNRMNAPIEDLLKFDALAAEVYKLARYYWKDRPFHGQLNAFLNNATFGRGRRFMKMEDGGQGVQNPDHTPMADAISKNVKDRAKPWKRGGTS